MNFGNDKDVVTKDEQDDNDMDVVIILKDMFENELENLPKSARIATFTFKTFLNIGMLLTDSDKARKLSNNSIKRY